MSPPKNANPARHGGAHGISQIDAAPTTRNQSSAQSNPSRTAQENARIAATAILNKARKLGIGVATDGDDVITISTSRMPLKTIRWFAIWLDNFRDEILDIISAENAGGRA